LRVTSSEIRIVLEDDSGNIQPIRAIIENVSGFVVKYEAYREVPADNGAVILKSIGPQGSLHLQPVNYPYPTKEWLQPKRYRAHVVGTTYVYDFPDLFRQAIRREWKLAGERRAGAVGSPPEPLEVMELVLDEFGVPQEVSRAPGSNTIGMVAWIFTMLTPESPNGRRVIVIANDITYKIGSFGPAEDQFFFSVSQLARKLGIPRIYLSANSGARLGIADELVDLFSAAWVDPASPDKGFKYLYMTPENQGRLKSKGEGSIITEKIKEDGEVRYKITDIIGLQDGLGVESLKGSGLIAGETSRAYDDIFTITLVTARSVGIGAYLVRLGQRAVQVEGQPIILTGAAALNKVLGREVYASNLQLGGTQIMYKNGVSHLTAANDLEGTQQIVRWLSYVPESRGKIPPMMPPSDSVDRLIDYSPPKGAYDPRWFLEGKLDDDGRWLSGFFDKGTFQETLSGWAQTVVREQISFVFVFMLMGTSRFRSSDEHDSEEFRSESLLSKRGLSSVSFLRTLLTPLRKNCGSWKLDRFVLRLRKHVERRDTEFSYVIRFGIPTRRSRPARLSQTSIVKAYRSSSSPTGVDSLVVSKTCLTKSLRGERRAQLFF
jgi:acetyl-CoA carboxylase/biotin carboxylase 1